MIVVCRFVSQPGVEESIVVHSRVCLMVVEGEIDGGDD